MDYKPIEEVCRRSGSFSERNHALAEHTSMKIGGECDLYIVPRDNAAAAEIIAECKSCGAPFFVLGRGSNVLVSDRGFRGCIVHMGKMTGSVEVRGNSIAADAGTALSQVCVKAMESGLGGLEFAYGIPGSVGGALFMNAGAYGGEMKDVVESCTYLDENGEVREMSAEEMKLRYRGSVFSDKRNMTILSVTFSLEPADSAAIKARMTELMDRRREKQPLEYPSCGSTFKRPEGYFAAALIEECGLKGYSVGGAQVSEKHSGFVINRNNAAFDDVMKLVEHIKAVVREQKGVELELEMLVLK